MARGVENLVLKAECVRLRLEERLSLSEISSRTGASTGSLSPWLKHHPLSPEERSSKWSAAQKRRKRKTLAPPAGFMSWVKEDELTRRDKAAIAEAAVLFRLVLNRLIAFGPVFDGSKEDWLVGHQSGRRVARIQVKYVRGYGSRQQGLPSVPLSCVDGHNKRRRYKPGEFDFIVGYDLRTDTAYVFSEKEVEGYKASIAIRTSAAERWRPILDFIAGVAQE